MEFGLNSQISRLFQLEMIESRNSFLVETSYNSEVDSEIREEIEEKFRKSKTNSQYRFPRVNNDGKSKKVFLSSLSLKKVKKSPQMHKSSKSLLNPYLNEKKTGKLTLGNSNKMLGSKNKLIQNKNQYFHSRISSTRTLFKEKSPDSKSPKRKKQDFVRIYSKSPKNSGLPSVSKLLLNLQPMKTCNKGVNRMNKMRLQRFRNQSKEIN